ncbi:MAG TPA: hypothetical protein VFH93_03990 [Thermoleophilia bacterium]|nr:hypothetical protein [Thermoleophilia bacterium]
MHDITAIEILRRRDTRATKAAETIAQHAAAARAGCVRAAGVKGLLGWCERPDRTS